MMRKWIGAVVMVVALISSGASTDIAAAAPSNAAVHRHHATTATDLTARRRVDRHLFRDHYAYGSDDRAYYPPYYDRPRYYAPVPFFMPFLGLGYGPRW